MLNTHHCKKNSKLRVHVYGVTVSEGEASSTFLLTVVDDSNLLSSDRQHRQLDSVELVKAAPRSRLSQPLKDK